VTVRTESHCATTVRPTLSAVAGRSSFVIVVWLLVNLSEGSHDVPRVVQANAGIMS
jgi:hypothetical protein